MSKVNKEVNKYMREIKPGVFVDVYDVLNAWVVTDPAIAHALKKLLCPGQRGVKTATQDIKEAGQSIDRSIEIRESFNEIQTC